jgi:hypothetical protein
LMNMMPGPRPPGSNAPALALELASFPIRV